MRQFGCHFGADRGSSTTAWRRREPRSSDQGSDKTGWLGLLGDFQKHKVVLFGRPGSTHHAFDRVGVKLRRNRPVFELA